MAPSAPGGSCLLLQPPTQHCGHGQTMRMLGWNSFLMFAAVRNAPPLLVSLERILLLLQEASQTGYACGLLLPRCLALLCPLCPEGASPAMASAATQPQTGPSSFHHRDPDPSKSLVGKHRRYPVLPLSRWGRQTSYFISLSFPFLVYQMG